MTSEKNGTTAGTPAQSKVVLDALRPLVIHEDNRGSVREAYRASWFEGVPPVRQIVHSESAKGVMRGMHAHRRQYDIWHFTSGEAQVQLYDHRSGYWQNLVLDGEHTLVIPPGVSHGFLALSDLTLTYFLTEEYNAESPDEQEWNALDKKWPGYKAWKIKRIRKFTANFSIYSPSFNERPFTESDLIRSERDLNAPSLREFIAAW